MNKAFRIACIKAHSCGTARRAYSITAVSGKLIGVAVSADEVRAITGVSRDVARRACRCARENGRALIFNGSALAPTKQDAPE